MLKIFMMEKLWCWRCRQVVGMLNEEEYRIAHELYGRGFKNNSGVYADRFRELLNYYFEITGEVITEPNAVMHHRIAQYGPPCEQCEKPYRTPLASFCAACGNRRNQE